MGDLGVAGREMDGLERAGHHSVIGFILTRASNTQCTRKFTSGPELEVSAALPRGLAEMEAYQPH